MGSARDRRPPAAAVPPADRPEGGDDLFESHGASPPFVNSFHLPDGHDRVQGFLARRASSVDASWRRPKRANVVGMSSRKPIEPVLEIEVAPAPVFEMWTTPDRLRAWWAVDAGVDARHFLRDRLALRAGEAS